MSQHVLQARFDDAQRGAHPASSWGVIEEVRTPKSRAFCSTPCAPPDENDSLFASSNNMDMRPREAPNALAVSIGNAHREQHNKIGRAWLASGSAPPNASGGALGPAAQP